MPPVGTARERFPIKFYLVCMIFILFDVETAFFYPWALIMQSPGTTYGLAVMVSVLHRPRRGLHLRVEGRSDGLVAAWSSPPTT